MAIVHAIAPPENDSERKAITYFKKHLPSDDYIIFHNLELVGIGIIFHSCPLPYHLTPDPSHLAPRTSHLLTIERISCNRYSEPQEGRHNNGRRNTPCTCCPYHKWLQER